MAEDTKTPDPDSPVSPSPARERGNVNAQQIRRLDTAESVARAARREPYAVALAAREISATLVEGLLTKISDCRDKIALGLQSAADRASATKAEAELQKQLTSQLRQIQASANQKYARDPKNKPQLRAYWIGSGLAVNRATLQEAAHDILDKLAADALPGVTTEFRNGVRSTLDAWKTANQSQAAANSAAVQAREDAARLLKEITDERLKIQFAIDAAYPVGEDGSKVARAAFGIPTTRPFRVR